MRGALHDDVAAGDPFGDAQFFFQQKLAVHHRHTPVTPTGEQLALLKPITKIAQMLSERDRLFDSR